MAPLESLPRLAKNAERNAIWRLPRSLRRVTTQSRGLKFTREGRVFVLVTLGIGLGAVNTGNNLLYLVLGLTLSLIILSGMLSDLVLLELRATRSLPQRLYAGSPALIEITVENRKYWLPSFSVHAEDRSDENPPPPKSGRSSYFLKIGPRESLTAAYTCKPMRRGILRFTGFRLMTRYPFGLFEKWRWLESDHEAVVYPRLIPVRVPSVGSLERSSDRNAIRPGAGHEFAALREHRPGDEVRAVHARRSAALGKLVIQERERERGGNLTIVLDDGRPEDASEQWDSGFEHAISRAASMIELASKNQLTIVLRTRHWTSDPIRPGASVEPLLRHLALLEPRCELLLPPLPSPNETTVVLSASNSCV